MRLIDADKLKPDCLTNNGHLAITQSQIAAAETVGGQRMTESKIVYEVKVERECEEENEELYFRKPDELYLFLRGFVRGMADFHSAEEYTITINKTKG